MTRQEAARLGGLALAAKKGPEGMREMGKKGYAATVTKIQAIIADPEAAGLTPEDAEGLAKFLKRRLQKTTVPYRRQFGREWRAGLKGLETGSVEERKVLFNKISGEMFGERGLRYAVEVK